jgi:hypothetical protein
LAHEQSSPHEDIKSKIPARWATLHDKIRRDRPEEPAEIEETGEPGIFSAIEIKAVLDAKDSCIG